MIQELPLHSLDWSGRDAEIIVKKHVFLPFRRKYTMPLIDPVTMSGMSGASQIRPSKSSMPIELLSTAIAGSNYASPLLLLAALYLRFPALVADPVPTLLHALIPVAVCQTAYCLYCLPVAGTNSRVAKKAQKSKGGTAKKSSDALLPAAKASVSTFQSLCKPYLTNANENST